MKLLNVSQPPAPGLRRALLPIAVIVALVSSHFPAAAQGRLEGIVINGTTGRPVADQQVQLLAGGAGMREVATTKTGSDGRFTLSQGGAERGAFYLIQTVFQNVNYRARVEGTTATRLTVYEATNEAADLRVRTSRTVVEAAGIRARVQEFFAIENQSQPPRTFANTGGTFRFRLGKNAESPTAAVLGQMNMPIPVAIQDGASPGELYINHALQPGLTVVMVGYEADYGSESLALDTRVDYPIARAELLVSPASLMVESSIFREAGVDSSTGLKKYEAESLAGGAPLAARVTGEAAAEPGEGPASEGEVRPGPNSMTRLGALLMVCLLLVMLWALGVRTAKEWKPSQDQKPESATRKELGSRLDTLLKSIADLDQLRENGKVAEKAYWKERLELKARVVAILKQLPPSLVESYATRNLPR